jgi:phage tail-like protein
MTTPRRSVAAELPPDLRDDPSARAVAAAIDAMLEPVFDLVEGIESYLDARTAPEAIVDWLAGLVGAYTHRPPSLRQRRRLVAAAPEIIRWWGTRRGLAALVRADTGVEPQIVEGADGTRPWVLVRVRRTDIDEYRLRTGEVEVDQYRLSALVASAIPAHVQGGVEIE